MKKAIFIIYPSPARTAARRSARRMSALIPPFARYSSRIQAARVILLGVWSQQWSPFTKPSCSLVYTEPRSWSYLSCVGASPASYDHRAKNRPQRDRGGLGRCALRRKTSPTHRSIVTPSQSYPAKGRSKNKDQTRSLTGFGL